MHKALREVLGEHVQQKGSLVDPDKTRFDFAHTQPMSPAEIREVERRVNAEILANVPTAAEVMPLEAAQQSGAVMLFGEKYADEVRVLSIGSSKELCGGTHVARTGDIGLFKITTEGGVAAGVRRVEAVTGENALALVQQREDLLDAITATLKAQPGEVLARVGQVVDHARSLEKELARLKSRLAASQGTTCCASRRCKRRKSARRHAGRGRCGDPARDHGQAQGQAELGGAPAGCRERWQGEPDRRRHR